MDNDPSDILNTLFKEWFESKMSNLPNDLTDRDITMLIKGFTGGAIMTSMAKDRQSQIEAFVLDLRNKYTH